MTNKVKVIICASSIAVAFATGRYSVSNPTIKTTEDIKSDTHEKQAEDTHTKTTIVTTKAPDGTVQQTETIDNSTSTHTTENTDTTAQIQQTVTPQKTGTLNLSVIVANDFSKGGLLPVYGASITKEVLGPVTIGAWGLTSGVLGVSLGLNF